MAGSKNPNCRPFGHTSKKKTANGHWPSGRVAVILAIRPAKSPKIPRFRANLSSKLTNPMWPYDRMAVILVVWPDGNLNGRMARSEYQDRFPELYASVYHT